jgi:NADPH:quinone reductase-like Zn-dependent oxidoreductase
MHVPSLPRAFRPTLAALLLGTLGVGFSSAASAAEKIRQWQFAKAQDGFELALKEVERPTPAANQVAVRVHAVSVNRRDLMMRAGRYGAGATEDGGIPLSDGAGEVVAVGPGVTRFKVGDRVAGIFFARWVDGSPSAELLASARGGNAGGMLSEVVVADPASLVAIPAHLSYEEAATLPCAGVTAWVGLFRRGGLEAGQYVLLEGTGGVSIFGLQLAKAAGAKPIITSSSDAKLARARELGAFGTVNYRQNPEWQIEVRKLTGGAGVSQVLEVGGQDTLPKALQALAFDGHVAVIGGLSGFASDVPVGPLMGLAAQVTGIYVGSRADFEALNAFLAEHKIKPVVDKVFEMNDAPAARSTSRAARAATRSISRRTATRSTRSTSRPSASSGRARTRSGAASTCAGCARIWRKRPTPCFRPGPTTSSSGCAT